MNKADLVDKISGACEISKAQAPTAIDTAVDSITSALRKGDRVALIGFGTFSVSQRKARNGRNPQTGATIKIAARKVAKFSPGAELKKAVNKKQDERIANQKKRQGSALPFSLPAGMRTKPVLRLQCLQHDCPSARNLAVQASKPGCSRDVRCWL